MGHLLHEFRWTFAIIGVVSLIVGLLAVAATRRPQSTGRNFGWFAVQLGAAFLLFNVSGIVTKYHGWSTATAIAGAVLLASSVRKLFQMGAKSAE
jgi:uncharacterized membrane protein HdeD (DUF308 family)